MKAIANKIKGLGYTKLVKGDGGITLYLKKHDSRLYYGASLTKFPKEISLAIGIFDTEILKTMSKVEDWETLGLNIVDFTYKKLVPLDDKKILDTPQDEGRLIELESKLNFLEANIDEIAEEYRVSLDKYDIPKSFSTKLLPSDDMIGLYYGLLNKIVLEKGEAGELRETIDHYISGKRPNAPVKFKIDLIMKYVMAH